MRDSDRIERNAPVAVEDPPRRRRFPWWILVVLLLLAAAGGAAGHLARSATVAWQPIAIQPGPSAAADSLVAEFRLLMREQVKVARRLDGRLPRDPYILINTSQNRLYLKQGSQVLREAVCSTGSYKELESPDGRRWFFTTPRGRFRILGKQENPVWIKPDWAFVEEGEPIPPKNAPERYEEGSLGLYAMSFGNGYLIHGTLYQRLLGRSVTHGCVRLGDDDLEAIYGVAKINTLVYIY
jgi:L,D-transpeptidase YbiS